MRAAQSKVESNKSNVASFGLCLLAIGFLCLMCGCAAVSERLNIRRDKAPYQADLAATYNRTRVNKSITLDVLPRIQGSPDEMLSQSESIVASVGQAKKGYKTWFTMVAFHEYQLTVVRKYFFDVDERARAWSKKSLRFDCEIALDKQILGGPYTDENAKRIAILRHVPESLRKDTEDLRRDVNAPSQNNETLNICGLLIKQVFETVLLRMDTSPVMASRLHEPPGVEFDHLNFGRGRIRMVIEDDIAKVKIRLGALADRFEETEQPIPAQPTSQQM